MFHNITDKILYKYRSAENISEVIRLISSGELWFSSARTFNDPFDTAITYNFDGVDSPIAEQWAVDASIRHMPNLSQSEKNKLVADTLRLFRTDPDYIDERRKEAIEHNYNSFGICSLAKGNDNLLMWSHYANKHTGICIGLNIEVIWQVAQELISSQHVIDLVKVTYSKSIPNINFFEAMLNDPKFEHIMKFVRTKFDDWSYEDEYRLVCFEHPNIPLLFGSKVVSEIVFGCRMQREEKDLLASYCRLKYPSVQLREARTDEHEFRLNIDNI